MSGNITTPYNSSNDMTSTPSVIMLKQPTIPPSTTPLMTASSITYPTFYVKTAPPPVTSDIPTLPSNTSINIRNFNTTLMNTSGSFYFSLSLNTEPLLLNMEKATYDEPAFKNKNVVNNLFSTIDTGYISGSDLMDRANCLQYLLQQMQYFAMYLDKISRLNNVPANLAQNTFSQYTFINRSLQFFFNETITKLNSMNIGFTNKSYSPHNDIVNYLNDCRSDVFSGTCDDLIGKTCKTFLGNDGNLVIYDINNKPIWASNTINKGKAPYRSVLQADGNLVVLDSTNMPIWSTGTSGQGKGPYTAIMQNDCNFALYDSQETPLWSSNTKIISTLPPRTTTISPMTTPTIANALSPLSEN